MTSITARIRARRRSLAVAAALVALVLAAVALLVLKPSPAHGMHHLVNRHHHLPHLLQVLLDARRLES
jgi:hypothetical protein